MPRMCIAFGKVYLETTMNRIANWNLIKFFLNERSINYTCLHIFRYLADGF